MNENDKLKEFLNKNLNSDLKRPVNEWAEISTKIENEKSRSWFLVPGYALAGLATILTLALVIYPQVNSQSYINEAEIVSFLEDSSDLLDEEDAEDYSYLALIE